MASLLPFSPPLRNHDPQGPLSHGNCALREHKMILFWAQLERLFEEMPTVGWMEGEDISRC